MMKNTKERNSQRNGNNSTNSNDNNSGNNLKSLSDDTNRQNTPNKSSKNDSHQKFPVLILLPVLLVIVLFIFIGILFKFSNHVFSDNSNNNNIIQIIYGIISGFIAVMIPLHYTISFDIIGKMAQAASIQNSERDFFKLELLFYCHIAEALIFSFGLFGASVLFEEAIVVSQVIGFTVPKLFKIIGHGVLLLTVIYGLCLNLKNKDKWFNSFNSTLKKEREKGQRIQILTIILCSILSGIWFSILFFSESNNLNGLTVLLILTLYYFWWIFFRALFAPLTNLKNYLLNGEN